MANKDVQQQLIQLDSAQSEPSPPAYFLSLTIANFRCFGPKQTLDLSDGNGRPARWTILLGDNGTGKTTLLQCLAALQPRPALSSGSGPYVAFFFLPLSQSYGLEINFVVELLNSSKNLGERPELNSTIYRDVKLSSPEKGKRFSGFSLTADSSGVFHGSALEKMGGLVSYGYGATRRMGKISLSEKREQYPTASLFSPDAELLNAEEWLLQSDYAARRQSAEPQTTGLGSAQARRDQIKDVLVKLLPDVDDIRVSQSSEDELQAIVEVKTLYGWVPIRGLSLGYQTMISWIVDLASRLFDRYPDSKNPLAEPAVVLVDEIDLHLHPKWQRTIMSFLSNLFPNTQFIATAHSPLVVQAATNANVVLLRREGDHVVIDNDVKAIEGWRVDQVLTSDLFGLESARPPQLDGLLNERNQILSKGKLTKSDEQRLRKIESELGTLPTGETPADIEAMDIIRRAAQLLQNKQATSRDKN